MTIVVFMVNLLASFRKLLYHTRYIKRSELEQYSGNFSSICGLLFMHGNNMAYHFLFLH